MTGYYTVAGEHEGEFLEKRSRFIGRIAPAGTEEEALAFIARMKKEHYEARHVAFAYVLKGGTVRASDDGEPQGTAGAPILAVLQKKAFFDVVLTVTRYFGGTLLGAGALTRAYARAAALAAEGADSLFMALCAEARLFCPYPSLKGAQELLNRYSATVTHIDYGEAVRLNFFLEKEGLDPLQAALTEQSGGKLLIEKLGEGTHPLPQKDE